MRALIDGLSFQYEDHGDGAPVLFIHGFPLDGSLWTPTVEQLRGSDVRALVPDLRGHGASEVSTEASMGRYAEDLLELLRAAKEDRPVVLVGLSMGGYIAFEFCRRYPERVRALVLVNTRAQPDTPEGVQTRLETAERVIREGTGGLADAMVDKLFSPATSPELRARWHDIMAANPPEGMAAALRAMAERPDSRPTLRSLTCPVLIVGGEDDRITPPEDARGMQSLASDSRLEIVPRAGHMTPVEQPDRFAAVLRDFLSRLPPLPSE